MTTEHVKAILAMMNAVSPEGYTWAARRDHRPSDDQRRMHVFSRVEFIMIDSQSDLHRDDRFTWA